MNGSQPPEKLFTVCRNPRVNLATIGCAGLALNEAAVAQPIDQFDGGMVSKLHPLRKHADCRGNVRRKAFDGQQQLMLLAVQAIFPGSLFAECEKFSDLVAKLCECAVILRIHIERLHIALRYLWNVNSGNRITGHASANC